MVEVFPRFVPPVTMRYPPAVRFVDETLEDEVLREMMFPDPASMFPDEETFARDD